MASALNAQSHNLLPATSHYPLLLSTSDCFPGGSVSESNRPARLSRSTGFEVQDGHQPACTSALILGNSLRSVKAKTTVPQDDWSADQLTMVSGRHSYFWCERGDSNFERLLILRKLQILRRT